MRGVEVRAALVLFWIFEAVFCCVVFEAPGEVECTYGQGGLFIDGAKYGRNQTGSLQYNCNGVPLIIASNQSAAIITTEIVHIPIPITTSSTSGADVKLTIQLLANQQFFANAVLSMLDNGEYKVCGVKSANFDIYGNTLAYTCNWNVNFTYAERIFVFRLNTASTGSIALKKFTVELKDPCPTTTGTITPITTLQPQSGTSAAFVTTESITSTTAAESTSIPNTESATSISATSTSVTSTTAEETHTQSSSTSDIIPNNNSSGEANRTGLYAGIGVAAGVALLLLIGGALFIHSKKRKNKYQQDNELQLRSNEADEPKVSLSNGNYVPINSAKGSQISEIVIPSDLVSPANIQTKFDMEYSELSVGKEIGSGAYGTVFRGRWRETDVAIKVMKSNIGIDQLKDFLKEADVMRTIRPHKNVVTFLGVCRDPLCIVTEFHSKGSLVHLLHSNFRI
eukprot:TRINITY_DN7435_c0_g1_i2.p1 TRINITY_DN7435_c0_g1~~TRINITY_DN7435_c0_g1_i2.p1  ORF type:complete len:454 (-),score=55.97 TRINITY_DN7435_c0_g1_i2:124-1485(-)